MTVVYFSHVASSSRLGSITFGGAIDDVVDLEVFSAAIHLAVRYNKLAFVYTPLPLWNDAPCSLAMHQEEWSELNLARIYIYTNGDDEELQVECRTIARKEHQRSRQGRSRHPPVCKLSVHGCHYRVGRGSHGRVGIINIRLGLRDVDVDLSGCQSSLDSSPTSLDLISLVAWSTS